MPAARSASRLTDVRVFSKAAPQPVCAGSSWPRATKSVVSMSVIRHFVARPEERAAYLKMRRAVAGLTEDARGRRDRCTPPISEARQERYAEMSAAGGSDPDDHRPAALASCLRPHDYPVRGPWRPGRHGCDGLGRCAGAISSPAFPVEMDDQIMLVTSTGQSIRCPVATASRFRSALGPVGSSVFNTARDEHVVSVAWIADQGDEGDEAGCQRVRGLTCRDSMPLNGICAVTLAPIVNPSTPLSTGYAAALFPACDQCMPQQGQKRLHHVQPNFGRRPNPSQKPGR